MTIVIIFELLIYFLGYFIGLLLVTSLIYQLISLILVNPISSVDDEMKGKRPTFRQNVFIFIFKFRVVI